MKNALIISIYLLIFGFSFGQVNQNDMDIKININESKINVSLRNNGTKPIKLWEFHNSWGWYTIKLIIKSESIETESETYFIGKLKNRAWTKNNPTFFEILPNSIKIFELSLFDGEWEVPDNLKEIKDENIILKLVIEIPESFEAKELGVFVGKLVSNEIRSNSPHNWLF